MRLALLAGGLGWAAVASGCALAAGGTSIARAPIVKPGVEETSNTASDQTVLGTRGSQATGCWIEFEYWRLPLQAGDRVVIGGSMGVPATNFELGVFPAGTTDADIANRTAVVTGFPVPGRTVRFTAASSGTYVLVTGPNCYNGIGGPFSFEATVTAPAHHG